ncbi:hypothetical protein NTA49_02625 [Photobacterium sp. TY 1-4]|uniref:Uncharacterized protein n=2 Tax=Pseudosulfitobacter koreensis TaxID=2968472 RepID=A0ABT1YX10_9RHOB|nr:hypothetical protein [Pseudosulfitobacter koreense]
MAVVESVVARGAAGGNIGERPVLYLSDGQSHADRQASAMKIPKDAAFDSTMTRSLSYTVRDQNTDLAVNRIPARPPSGFRMTEIMVQK